VRQPAGQLELDEALLARIGLNESEVYDLRDRWDRAQLARLELNDLAAREGWLFRPRHRRELQALDEALRQELGEADYDRMLYATDQNNRVVVKSVIGGSAAATAGLREGDYVLSYDSERTFKPGDVRRGTTAGVKGEPVRVIVERSGDRLSFVVPRGPLGVRMAAEQGPPAR
jgi:membrane-associated protease RseP (regulator of RpoE activity)